MPRLTPAVLRTAREFNRHLPLLLRECRDLDSARNELRWMREGIIKRDTSASNVAGGLNDFPDSQKPQLSAWVNRRARGEPLQYILGNTPFGDLEIKCRPGVLIPRSDTETWVDKVVSAVSTSLHYQPREERLRVADFCTGTGCIALSLYQKLSVSLCDDHDGVMDGKIALEVYGFDISSKALELARENLKYNIELSNIELGAEQNVSFRDLDVLKLAENPGNIHSMLTGFLHRTSHEHATSALSLDVIVSNPPYIRPSEYSGSGAQSYKNKPRHRTARSVVKYEPGLALVPPPLPESCQFSASTAEAGDILQADQFYTSLLKIALACRTKLIAVEVGDLGQAKRVVKVFCALHAEQYAARHNLLFEIYADDGREKQFRRDGTSRSQVHDPDELRELSEDWPARAVVMWLNGSWTESRADTLKNQALARL